MTLRRWLVPTFLLWSSVTMAADWPSWRGPDRTGITPETDWSHDWPAEGPKTLWKASVGVGFSSVVVADGRVFTLGHQEGSDVVSCLSASTGQTLWTHSYPQPLGNKMYEGGPNSTPLVVGNQVFTASKTGELYALDTATGQVQWHTSLKEKIGATLSDWGVSGAPVWFNDQTVLINYGPHGVGLDPATGKILWDSGKKKDMSFAAPVLLDLDGQPTALFFMSEALVAVNPRTGSTLWKSSFGQGYRTHCSDPVVRGNQVFISSGDDGGELLEVSGKGARRLWKNKNLSTFTGTAVLIAGHLYGHETAAYKTADQELRCLDFQTGAIRWSEKGFGQGSLIASGDRLIVLSDKGEVTVARATPEKFVPLARTHPIGGKCWTTPTLANQQLYLRNAKGDLICLDLSPPAKRTL